MAIDLTPEQRELGKKNFAGTAEGLSRRGFMKSLAAGAGGLAVGAGAYFGYKALGGNPVKAALIGAGDEGGVLVGEHNPDFLQFVAVCDIRPTNMDRIFTGEDKGLRKGFNRVYGKEAGKIKKYDGKDHPADYRTMLEENPDIEAVVIALPLHLHAPVAVECMKIGHKRGKGDKPIHVLCEKLMAWNVMSCKKMIRAAKKYNSILSIGHQRHYSMLYAHALEVVQSGVLGDVRHIRALWHRNMTWPFKAPTGKGKELASGVTQPVYKDSWFREILARDAEALADKVKLAEYGFDNIEQLVRWRIYRATGAGLMAELGSHQLDACSIFLGKVHPLAVSGVGAKLFYGKGRNDRDIADHVFVTYEFPGKDYASNKEDRVIVTYSSLNTNQFENYGECVEGTRGTLVVEKEQAGMLFKEQQPNSGDKPPRSMEVSVSAAGKGEPALESSGSDSGPAPVRAGAVAGTGAGPISRGYREEMEHFAYCIRQWDAKKGYAKKDGQYEQALPRCHGEVAMADAIVALTANIAMEQQRRIPFESEWFDADSDKVPDPDTKAKVPFEV